jgi:hypothetical protein
MGIELPYILAKPVKMPSEMRRVDDEQVECGPTDYVIIGEVEDAEQLASIWEGHEESGEPYLTIDLETNGTEAHKPECIPVLVGLYSPVRGGIVIDLRTSAPGVFSSIARKLCEWKVPLQGYNLTFDGAFLQREVGRRDRFNYHSDAYVFHRLICGEGFENQRFGLKPSQISLLGWEDKGDALLDEWLVSNGHAKQNGKPRKEMMHLAPAEILGHYCILDCYSTHLLYKEVFLPVIEKFPILAEYMEWFFAIIRNVIRQQLRGMLIDAPRMEAHAAHLRCDICRLAEEFMAHPQVKPHLDYYNQLVIDEFFKTQPTQFKKPPKEPKEPKQFKQDGTLSKSWLKWKDAHAAWEAYEPEVTQHWVLWWDKARRVRTEMHFKMTSGADLRWLFYDQLHFPVKVLTDSELPAVSGDALLGFGEAGKIMDKFNEVSKELGYVSKALEVQRDSTIHAQFKVPGTLTCRLAGGGGLNMQQVPKTNGYLSCYVARPGMRLVDIDYSGLEDYVLAELSRDASMLKLYGPGAPECQDGYIFVASQIAQLGGPFRALGYDPDNPTKEAVDRCKKELKGLRNIAKVLRLSKNYGAGPVKIHKTLELKSVDITFEQVKAASQDFDRIFAGNLKWKRWQEEIYESTDGWVLDGLGGPVCIDPNYVKDLANRIVQRTGHLILAHYIWSLEQELDRRGIQWEPYIIDFHDEVILEVPESEVAKVKQCMVDVIAEQRKFLGGIVHLKANPDEGGCLAPFKTEDFKDWLALQPLAVQEKIR